MILTCPSCSTHYFADDSTIGESGRTVKCAACGHSWFVRPPGEEDPAKAERAAHEVYRERLREQRRGRSRLAAFFSWIITAALFASLTAAAFIFRNDVVKVWPQSAAAYRLAGFDVNRFGLNYDGIVHTRTFNDTIPVVTVTGRALNVAQTSVETPGIRVDLKDEAGRVVATRYSYVTPPGLAPGEAGRFGVVVEPAPVESYEIEITFVERSAVPREPLPERAGAEDAAPQPDEPPAAGDMEPPL
jgi:predicted Zn finger-like uncharacterized protein